MKYRKLPEHTPDNYLKAILESIVYYNAMSRADISNWLFEGYKEALKTPQKETSRKTIILELLSKWIQVFEDLALLCMMFSGQLIGDDRDPYEIYVDNNNQKILKFLDRTKRGLPKRVVSKIYGIKTATELIKENKINENEYIYFKEYLDKLIDSGNGNLVRFAKEYASRRKKGKPNYSSLVNVYFNTKHGFKVIHPTPTSKKLWSFYDSDIVLVRGIGILRRTGRKLVPIGIYKEFSKEEVELLVNRINGWSEVTKEIAESKLKELENPYWTVTTIRVKKSKELISKGVDKPGRNEPCLCGSNIKFKKCCYLFLTENN